MYARTTLRVLRLAIKSTSTRCRATKLRNHRLLSACKTNQNLNVQTNTRLLHCSTLILETGGGDCCRCCCCYLSKNTSFEPCVRLLAENRFENRSVRSCFLLFRLLFRLSRLFAPLPDRPPPWPRCRGKTVVGPLLGHSGFLHACTRCVRLGFFSGEGA
jgi:hypothetical protein